MNLVFGNDFFKESYMKLKNSWILLLACLCLYSACREEQKTTQIIVKKQQVAAPKATQKMGDYQQSRPVEWLGAEYTVTVDLKADTSLPLVKEGNQKYYDNRIRLTITRSDKSQFFSREFTKADFSAYLDNAYARDGALLGIVLDRADGDHLVFAASIGSPDKSSDEYLPLVMRISRLGEVSVSRDTQLDTNAADAAGEEDDGV